MYKFIMRNQKNTGHAVFYDEKNSTLRWNVGASIETDEIDFDTLLDNDIKDFIESIKNSRRIDVLENYKFFREECLHCPVVQLCQGKPLFEETFKESCDIAYANAVQDLYLALMILTKMKLESIEGDIRRPE